jgi:NodT family efflux transporter outer membrane factor (OMF) lipoprotein
LPASTHRPAMGGSQVSAPRYGAQMPTRRRRRAAVPGALVTVLAVAACAVGPNYHKPSVEIPDGFKEGTDWRRAEANPSGALASTWWTTFQDDTLNQLVESSLKANQSIAAAEAAYRLAKATVDANVANLYPTIGAGLSASRASYGAGASDTGTKVIGNEFVADLSLSWELDLWGQIRREIESAKAAAEASDAQLAGERLSIASSVALDYFALRQADIDVDLLKQQQDIYQRILAMTQAEVGQGTASNDDLLVAQDNLELVIADLQSTEISREQYEHAIAVLIGKPPEEFSLPSEARLRVCAARDSRRRALGTPRAPLRCGERRAHRRVRQCQDRGRRGSLLSIAHPVGGGWV